MRVFISKMLETVTRHILRFTLYDMMLASPDFEDVKAALNDRTDWSIELFRSCFTVMTMRLNKDISFYMLSTLSFLVMAENIHIHYGRLSPAELKERAEYIGYTTFAILFAMLDVGCIIVRIAGLVALCRSPSLAAGLALVSMSPSIILPVLTYPVTLLKQRKRESAGDAEIGTGAQ